MVDLEVTKTIDAPSAGCYKSYSMQEIPNIWYCYWMSAYNATSGIIIIVVSLWLIHASNMNNKLFSAPVGMMATIGLCR